MSSGLFSLHAVAGLDRDVVCAGLVRCQRQDLAARRHARPCSDRLSAFWRLYDHRHDRRFRTITGSEPCQALD